MYSERCSFIIIFKDNALQHEKAIYDDLPSGNDEAFNDPDTMIPSFAAPKSFYRKQRFPVPVPGVLVTCIVLLLLNSGCSGGFFSSARESISNGEDGLRIGEQIIIRENTIYQNNRSGLRIRGNTPVSVRNCTIYQNGRAGVNLEHAAEVSIEESDIFGNKNSGIGADNTAKVFIKNTKIHQNQQGGIRVRQDQQSQQMTSLVVLRQNKIFLNGQSGVYAVAGTPEPIQLSVSGNSIYRNSKAGIRIEDNLRLTADNNEIFRNGAAGIAAYLFSDLPPKFDIYQNKVAFNLGSGIFIGSGISGSTGISNNLIYNNYRAGIALGLLDNAGDELIDVQVFHNTIVGNGSDEEGAGIRNDSRGDILIKNNIIAYNFTTGILSDGCDGFSYNLLFANGETSSTSINSDTPAYLTEKLQYSGCSGRQWGDVLAPPLFFDPDRYNFSLLDNSPAKNAAATIHSPYFQAFPNKDLGAAPFSSAGRETAKRP